jgi:hypothetical protein
MLSYDAGACVEQGGRWLNFDRNFDNVLSALQSLLEISTTEGWVTTMFHGVDAVGPMQEPRRDHTPLGGMYFVFFILIGTFFVLNLCVSVIIDNFNKMTRDNSGADILMTETQKRWMDSQVEFYKKQFLFPITNIHLLPPSREKIYRIVDSPYFEAAIMACILLNTAIMAAAVFPPPTQTFNGLTYTDALKSGNFWLAQVFNVEFVLKVFSMQRAYFYENWNIFDCFCVVLTNGGIAMQMATNFDGGGVMSALRLFRVARLFRLVKFLKGLSRLFNAFLLSLFKLFNVGCILMLLLGLYAVLGVELFSKVKAFRAHDDQANFRSFGGALVTLLRCMTGEAWNEIMHSLRSDKFMFESVAGIPCASTFQVTEENYPVLEQIGYLDQPYQCGAGMGAIVYFLSFTLIVTLVVLNLFVAVIFEGFEDSQKAEEREVIARCCEVWKHYDKDLTLVLPLEDCLVFIGDVIYRHAGQDIFKKGEKIGGKRTIDVSHANALRLEYVGNSVHFRQTMLAILRWVCIIGRGKTRHHARTVQGELDKMEIDHQHHMEARFGHQRALHQRSLTAYFGSEDTLSYDEYVAAMRIQRRFKEKMEKRRGKTSADNEQVADKSADHESLEDADARWERLRESAK